MSSFKLARKTRNASKYTKVSSKEVAGIKLMNCLGLNFIRLIAFCVKYDL